MKRYLTTKDVCDLLGCSSQTLWRRVNARSFPPPTYPGKPNKWLANVVIEYEAALAKKTLGSLRKPMGITFSHSEEAFDPSDGSSDRRLNSWLA